MASDCDKKRKPRLLGRSNGVRLFPAKMQNPKGSSGEILTT